ncbi:hypothetical protein ACWDYJ_08830 [Streptomyces sp. NPDC003042]
MSVNIEFSLTVTGLRDDDEAHEVLHTLVEVMHDERIHDQVNLGIAWEDGQPFVAGETGFPLSISRFHLWQPEFEGMVVYAVKEVARTANVALDWGYPDERGPEC